MIDLAEVCFLSLSSCKLWNLWWLFRQDFMQSTPLSCLYNMDQGCSYYWIHQGPFTASFKPQSCTRREKERETMFLFLVFLFFLSLTHDQQIKGGSGFLHLHVWAHVTLSLYKYFAAMWFSVLSIKKVRYLNLILKI